MNYACLCVGTADLEASLRLWRNTLGLQSAAPQGDTLSSRQLERLWLLPEGVITQCQMLETPGAPGGALLLVEFPPGTRSIRANAAVTDLCPKNIDVNVIDLPARARELQAAGYRLRSEPVEYAIGDLQVREVHVPVEEGVNLVLVEILGEPLVTTSRHYAAVTSVVTTTADTVAESAFFECLGFSRLDYHRLVGETVERMVGLRPGGVLEMQLLGDATHRFGRAELVSYGVDCGSDLYPRAVPPALGLFRGAIRVDNVATLRAGCLNAGYAVSGLQDLSAGEESFLACSVQSPSGWMVDLLPA
ncbi:MAG: hypothetical protein RIC38_10250 [Chromatocurvus sp.]